MGMQRKPAVRKITFNDSSIGVTADGKPLDVSQYAIAGIHASAGMDGRLLTIRDVGEWGNHEIIQEKELVEGFNYLTQTELLRFSSAMQITFAVDVDVTGAIYLKLKS